MLRVSYFLRGLSTWSVDRDAKVPYKIGVILDWPNKQDEIINKQIRYIVDTANKIAKKYSLEALLTEPIFAAGVALVMYVRFVEQLKKI